MKAKDIRIGENYQVKVSERLATVRIDCTHPSGGWYGTNLATGRQIRLRTAGRLRANLTVQDMIRTQTGLERGLHGEAEVRDAEIGWAQRQKDEEAKRLHGTDGPESLKELFRF